MPPLILHGLPSIHWALAGGVIGLVTLALLYLANRSLGISTGFEDACALVLRVPYFQRPALADRWRFWFLGGLVLGGVISAVAGGGWSPTWALGMFDAAIGLGPLGKLGWMFGGGLLIGFGTRLAGGCTSGHGIFGLSNLELPSLLATLSFMAAGVVTTNLIYRVALGG